MFPETASGRADGVVTVDEQPSGAVLVWYPPRSTPTCRAVLTRLDTAAATRLAHDIDSAPATVPGAAYNCASGQGAGVVAFFTYPGRPSAETVRIDLDGCSFVRAAERLPRLVSTVLRSDLAPATPPAWASYTSQSTH